MAKRTRSRRPGPASTPPAAAPAATAPATSAIAAAPRRRFWLDFEVPWASWAAFRAVFFLLHAVDAVLQIAHAPRYGAGGFNVAQLPLPLPLPTRTGMTVVYGTLAIACTLVACGVAVRGLLPIAAALYTYAYFISQLDSYQHHYLMCLVLGLLCLVPTAPTTTGADGRGWLRSWALRLVLVQLAIVYLWATIAKLEGPWLDGTLLSRQIQPGTVRSIASGVGFGVVAKLVVATEATLASTVWNRRLWWLAAPLGVGLHTGIEFIGLEIGLFSYYMIASYLLVLPAGVGGQLARAARPIAAATARIPTAAIAGGAAIALAIATVIVARDPLPLAGAIGLGLAMIATAVGLAWRRGRRAMTAALAAGALAMALLAGVLAAEPIAADHFRTWGGASRRLGLASERAAYQGLLRVDPSSEYAHFYLGQLEVKDGALDAARAHFAAGQRGAPTRARCYLAEANLLATQGDTAGALAVIERGLAHIPDDAELVARRARLRGAP